MTEKYWMSDRYRAEREGLETLEALQNLLAEDDDHELHVMVSHERVPEWYWFDATEDELHLNVHQSYFPIAEDARSGGKAFKPFRTYGPDYNPYQLELDIRTDTREESFFTPRTNLEQPEWVSYVLQWSDVFQRLTDDNSEVHRAAKRACHELDSIVQYISFRRFSPGTATTQLVGPFYGTLTLGGEISPDMRWLLAAQAKCTEGYKDGTTIYQPDATKVVRAIGKRLFDSITPINEGVGIDDLGRFESNTGIDMGTGSLLVMHDDIHGEEGYQYSSHNLDSPLTQLWAFGGVARLIGDSHRKLAAQQSRI